jgi:tellurite resistance protein
MTNYVRADGGCPYCDADQGERHRLNCTANKGDRIMGILGNMFKGRAKDAINAFSGNKDFLEGLCAGCALTAAAEGGIDDAEYDAALGVMRANTAIAAAFSSSEMEQCFGKMTPKTGTRSGKAELKNEIRQVIERDKTGQMGMAIILACLDVADAGGISAPEEAVMREIAGICNVNYDKAAG